MAQLTAESAVAGTSADAARTESGPKIGSIAGIVIGTLTVFGAFLIEGGDLASLILPSPFLIVVGGTIGALLLAHPASQVLGFFGLVGQALAGRHNAAGAQVLRDAGTYAIITSLIALVMGAIVILSNLGSARPDQFGHAAAVAFVAPLYGLILSLMCFALSRRLRGTA